jgi:hypothetical protein
MKRRTALRRDELEAWLAYTMFPHEKRQICPDLLLRDHSSGDLTGAQLFTISAYYMNLSH